MSNIKGEAPLESKGTLANVRVQKHENDCQVGNDKWKGFIVSSTKSSIKVRVTSSVEAVVSAYKVTVKLYVQEDGEERQFINNIRDEIYLLFNPWNNGETIGFVVVVGRCTSDFFQCYNMLYIMSLSLLKNIFINVFFFQICNPCSDDQVYMANAKEREEYVLNDTGRVYMGNAVKPHGRPWAFGQVRYGNLHMSRALRSMSIAELCSLMCMHTCTCTYMLHGFTYFAFVDSLRNVASRQHFTYWIEAI